MVKQPEIFSVLIPSVQFPFFQSFLIKRKRHKAHTSELVRSRVMWTTVAKMAPLDMKPRMVGRCVGQSWTVPRKSAASSQFALYERVLMRLKTIMVPTDSKETIWNHWEENTSIVEVIPRITQRASAEVH
ncbi:MAG TPA: hypothetical protein DCQ94_12150 [Nitrospira sp.]|nr:hypothetical protein [Nitrospira sp.]